MRKFLIVFLAVVLTLSLGLVACKAGVDKGDGNDVVSLTVLDTLELKVGETPDFNGHVKVVVNGDEVTNPTVTCKLKDGDPNVAGRCTYQVVYTYKGTEYSKNGFVNFRADSVVLLGNNFTQFIEKAIVWKEHVTVKVNNSAIANPTLTAVIKSGTVAAGNDVEYTVTYVHEGTSYTKDITVTYTDIDPDDVDLIDTLFAKEYASYTVQYYYYETDAVDEPSMETDNVYWDEASGTLLFKIHYVDDAQSQDLLYYLTINYESDTVKHYSDSFTDNEDWEYKTYSFENDYEKYGNWMPYGYAPEDVADHVFKQHFTKVANNKFAVKNAYLQDVAEWLFSYDFSSDYTTYTKIELETDGERITKVTGYYTNTMYAAYNITFDCVVSYTWSDVDETEFELPEATEYQLPYATPDKAEDLSGAQITALNAALDKTYTSINYEYIDFKDDYWYSYMGEGTYIGSATYDSVVQFYLMDGEAYQKASIDVIFANNTVYSLYNDKNDYYSWEKTSTAADQTYYIAFADFGFTADMFGWSEQYGVYVVKADALASLQEKVLANVWTLGGPDSIKVETFTFKLDADNNVTEWFLVAECTYEETDEYDEESYSIEMTCTYSEFNSATLNVPYAFDNLTAIEADSEMETTLNAALSNDIYQNVTVVEHGNGYTMYINGLDLRVDGTEYNSSTGQGTAFSKVYQIGEDEEGETTYCELVGGIKNPCTLEDILFNVLYFNFEMLRGHMQYNAATDTYVCHVADFDEFNNNDFAYYWSNFFGEGQTIDDIELTIENGHVVFVRMYVSIDVTETDEDTGEETTYTQHNTMSATLSAFGETVFPSEATPDDTTED